MRITVDDCGQGWLEIANPLGRTNGKQKAHESKFRLSFHIIFIIKSQMSLWESKSM